MKVLKICIGDWKNASHDKRELSAVREMGHEVEVVAKGPVSGAVEEVDGFKVTRLTSRPLGEKVPNAINRALSMLTWASYVRKRNDVDVISGHDYLALTIGYLSNFFKKKKAILVYDSHEYELERNNTRSKLTLWCICHLERFLMKRCAFSLMVSDSIADEIQQVHKLEERPYVVRNTPSRWILDQEKIAQTRAELLQKLGLPSDTFIVMFHGVWRKDNGVEHAMEAVRNTPGTAAVLVGPEPPDLAGYYPQMAKDLGIDDRTLFHPPVPLEELYRYVSAADVGVVLLPPVTKNNLWALPNKLFENIQSMTPIVAGNTPEIARIIERYQIGLTIPTDSMDEMVKAVQKMKEDKEFYTKCKENLKFAKEDLCWEKEKLVLQKAYSTILR